jgi:hypothetical protein
MPGQIYLLTNTMAPHGYNLTSGGELGKEYSKDNLNAGCMGQVALGKARQHKGFTCICIDETPRKSGYKQKSRITIRRGYKHSDETKKLIENAIKLRYL